MIFSRANIGTFFTSVAIQGCGVVTGVVTARLLGPASRGELATVLLWPIILTNLGLMGCNWALARQVAGDSGNESHHVCNAAAVGLAASCLYFILGYLLIPYVLPKDRIYLLLLTRFCLLLIPLDIFSQILLGIEHGRMRWQRYNFVRASFFIFYSMFVCWIWASRKADVRWFVWAFLASHLLAVLLRLVIQRKSFASGKIHFAECIHLLRSGLPYFWATASNLFSAQLDKILVVSLLDAQAAGIYAVALTFGNAQSSLGEALGITSFAITSNEKSSESRKTFLMETFRHSALVSAGLGLALSCLIPFLVRPLFGADFSAAIRPAMILAIAAALTTSSDILNEGLRGAGRPYAGLVSQLLGTAVLAIAALLLLRKFGLVGMAWAVLVGASAQVGILVAAAANWLQVSPSRFWPFGIEGFKAVFREMAELRSRYSRSPA